MTGQLGSKPSFGYPNQMGRIILHVTQNMTTPDEYNRLLETAGLTQYIDHPPAGDLEHGFLFESVSALQLAAETIYGAEAGREFNRKVGRACLEGGLREFNPLLGIADLPARVLPLGLKLHVGFDMFAIASQQASTATSYVVACATSARKGSTRSGRSACCCCGLKW